MKKFSREEYLKNPDRKVTTRNGRPVRIICTNSRSNVGCVIGLVGENDAVYVWDEYGSHKVSEDPINDLFFADEEEELTEFEKAVATCMFPTVNIFECKTTVAEVKHHAKILLELARKQLEFENYNIYKKAYMDGREDEAKDLPKWKNTIFTYKNPEVPKIETKCGPSYQLHYKGLWIDVDELFKKLPKE